MTPIEPDAYVDVTGQMDAKHTAFLCHASQWESWEIDGPTDPNYAEKVWTRFKERFTANGAKCGVGYAEAFICREKTRRAPWLLHAKL